MATMTHAQAQSRLKKLLEAHTYDSWTGNECPVCGDKITPDQDDWEYVKTKRGSEIFIHTFCVKHWGSDLSKAEMKKLRKKHELEDF